MIVKDLPRYNLAPGKILKHLLLETATPPTRVPPRERKLVLITPFVGIRINPSLSMMKTLP